MGCNVIKSHPGGTQDILEILRKNKGVYLHIIGLSNFGILGDYFQGQGNVSHHEVDVITLAMFVFSGRKNNMKP